jgi:hypothetical protein
MIGEKERETRLSMYKNDEDDDELHKTTNKARLDLDILSKHRKTLLFFP